MTRTQRGQVTAFVVVVFVALIAVAGLVVDGGTALAAKRQAIDEAAAAARAGAQALSVDAYRADGTVALDPEAARAAAEAYLAQTGHAGVVEANADTVTVTVTFEHSLTLLRVVGVRQMTVTGSGTAHPVRGVGTP